MFTADGYSLRAGRAALVALLLCAASWWVVPDGVQAAEEPKSAATETVPTEVMSRLETGDLTGAAQFLEAKLENTPDDAQAGFALGVVQVLQAIERLAQSQYAAGAIDERMRQFPILRLPVPKNPEAKPISYPEIRQIVATFQGDIARAEQQLASVKVSAELHLPLDLSKIRLDVDGDGERTADERLLVMLGLVTGERPGAPAAAPVLSTINFDGGDVYWLRGYCHFLQAVADVMLAYDHQALFDVVGRFAYPKYVGSDTTSEPLYLEGTASEPDLLDAIAAIHLFHFPLKEPERLPAARGHLLEMIRTSRLSWEQILLEQDDDHEWLPNPQQTGVLRIPVSREQIDGWHEVLQECEDLLEGRKLIPFWRDENRMNFFSQQAQPIPPEQRRGINLKKFFEEPREFDLVLMFQGEAMRPYLQRGEMSSPETWTRLRDVFRGNFFGFAVWFN